MPLLTARVSSVSRCGKYHSVPSELLIPIPENIVAKRLIGVSAPVPSQPCSPFFVVVDTPLPRCACAASRLVGEVPTFSA